MRELLLRKGVTLAVTAVAIVASGAVYAQPQGPNCGKFKVFKDTKIESRLFPKGNYQLHVIGVSCAEVAGENRLFAKFLSLGEGVPLPRPWKSLVGAVEH
jgi:hypothetical protein